MILTEYRPPESRRTFQPTPLRDALTFTVSTGPASGA